MFSLHCPIQFIFHIYPGQHGAVTFTSPLTHSLDHVPNKATPPQANIFRLVKRLSRTLAPHNTVLQLNMTFPEPIACCVVLLVQLQSKLIIGSGMQVWAAQDGT